MERNYLSVEKNNLNYEKVKTPKFKKLSSISEVSKNNSYLYPVKQIDNNEKYNISPDLCNSGSYAIQRKKIFANSNRDDNINSNSGRNINKEDYISRKKSFVGYYFII
jgi:hypothetical protein